MKVFKKHNLLILISAVCVLLPTIAAAADPIAVKLMSGFPGIGVESQGIIPFLNVIFNILLTGASILAVIFIAIGGFEIMSSDTPFSISVGKDRIQHAIIGLIIMIGSYVILMTINPAIVSFDIFKNLKPVLSTHGATPQGPTVPGQTPQTPCVPQGDGLNCQQGATTVTPPPTPCVPQGDGLNCQQSVTAPPPPPAVP